MFKLILLVFCVYILYGGYREYKGMVKWMDQQAGHISVKVQKRVSHSVNHAFDDVITEVGSNISKGVDLQSMVSGDTIDLATLRK